jgi:hypothetical protein
MQTPTSALALNPRLTDGPFQVKAAAAVRASAGSREQEIE